jgi:hypothetical protein
LLSFFFTLLRKKFASLKINFAGGSRTAAQIAVANCARAQTLLTNFPRRSFAARVLRSNGLLKEPLRSINLSLRLISALVRTTLT